jgi:hypothetical protein
MNCAQEIIGGITLAECWREIWRPFLANVLNVASDVESVTPTSRPLLATTTIERCLFPKYHLFMFTVHYNTHRLLNRDATEVMLTAWFAKMFAVLIRPDGYRSLLS